MFYSCFMSYTSNEKSNIVIVSKAEGGFEVWRRQHREVKTAVVKTEGIGRNCRCFLVKLGLSSLWFLLFLLIFYFNFSFLQYKVFLSTRPFCETNSILCIFVCFCDILIVPAFLWIRSSSSFYQYFANSSQRVGKKKKKFSSRSMNNCTSHITSLVILEKPLTLPWYHHEKDDIVLFI